MGAASCCKPDCLQPLSQKGGYTPSAGHLLIVLLHLQVRSILLFVRGCKKSDLQPATSNFFPFCTCQAENTSECRWTN
jgi:hypothetical protein